MGKGYPQEFWEWAYKKGLPLRGPVGSDQNIQRALRTPQLYREWHQEQKAAKSGPV